MVEVPAALRRRHRDGAHVAEVRERRQRGDRARGGVEPRHPRRALHVGQVDVVVEVLRDAPVGAARAALVRRQRPGAQRGDLPVVDVDVGDHAGHRVVDHHATPAREQAEAVVHGDGCGEVHHAAGEVAGGAVDGEQGVHRAGAAHREGRERGRRVGAQGVHAPEVDVPREVLVHPHGREVREVERHAHGRGVAVVEHAARRHRDAVAVVARDPAVLHGAAARGVQAVDLERVGLERVVDAAVAVVVDAVAELRLRRHIPRAGARVAVGAGGGARAADADVLGVGGARVAGHGVAVGEHRVAGGARAVEAAHVDAGGLALAVAHGAGLTEARRVARGDGLAGHHHRVRRERAGAREHGERRRPRVDARMVRAHRDVGVAHADHRRVPRGHDVARVVAPRRGLEGPEGRHEIQAPGGHVVSDEEARTAAREDPAHPDARAVEPVVVDRVRGLDQHAAGDRRAPGVARVVDRAAGAAGAVVAEDDEVVGRELRRVHRTQRRLGHRGHDGRGGQQAALRGHARPVEQHPRRRARRHAAVERVVVDAVAVLVDAVAGLGARQGLPHAAAPTARAAGLRAAAADAHAAGARGTRVAGAREALVDEAVAVVVLVVAALRRRGHLPGARRAPRPRGAGLRARAAEAHAAGARRAGVAAPGHALVAAPVAVVVDVVADLDARRGLAGAHARPPAGHAGLGAGAAGAHALGAARARVAAPGHAVVDEAVAVVVDVVAGLRRRELLTRAAAPRARSADLRTRETGANARGPARTRVAAPDQSLVDLPIAVVVDVVAELGRGRARGHRADGARAVARADDAAGAHAGARALGAGHPEVRKALVAHAVAVVVLAVADLRRRDHLTRAGAPHARGAGLVARAADAHTRGARGPGVAAPDHALVDRTVAVVVDVVAGLDARADLTRAGAPAPDGAGLRPGGAGAHARGATRAAVAGAREALVDEPVAVVVDVVADLGARRTRAGGAHRAQPIAAAHHGAVAQTRAEARGARLAHARARRGHARAGQRVTDHHHRAPRGVRREHVEHRRVLRDLRVVRVAPARQRRAR